MKSVAIVIPTIRHHHIRHFLEEWQDEFSQYPNLKIYIIEAGPTNTFSLPYTTNIEHLSWKHIDQDLGEKHWIISHRSDCIRSYGYYRAYRDGADVVITMDDDCCPAEQTPYFISGHLKNLERRVSTQWFNTLAGRIHGRQDQYPRGFPYGSRDTPVVLSHGLWSHIPDWDAETQLSLPPESVGNVEMVKAEAAPIPRGVFFPMSSMNIAVKRDIIPSFYALLMGANHEGGHWGVDRFGDTWSGMFVKKIIDHLNLAAVSGSPLVRHERASDPARNFAGEAGGRATHEWLPTVLNAIEPRGASVPECYRELALAIPPRNEHFRQLKEAMRVWADLFA